MTAKLLVYFYQWCHIKTLRLNNWSIPLNSPKDFFLFFFLHSFLAFIMTYFSYPYRKYSPKVEEVQCEFLFLPHWNPGLDVRHSLCQMSFILQPQSTLHPFIIICYWRGYEMFKILIKRSNMVEIGRITIRISSLASLTKWISGHQYYMVPF